MQKRAWAEIDTNVLAENFRAVRATTSKKILAMVKANAYGHGAVEASRIFMREGASMLGVACVDEVAQLRKNGIDASILIVGSVPHTELADAIRLHAVLSVSSLEEATAISREAEKQKKLASVHIKVDTGMTRLGFSAWETEKAKKVFALPGIRVEGVFSHLACADDPEENITKSQYAAYKQFVQAIQGEGLLQHICSSTGIFRFPAMHCGMVRPGICLYGENPMPEGMGGPNLREAMTVRATVARVASVPAGTCVGYGATYTAEKPMQVATVMIGYGDGIFRALSNRGSVILRGKRVPIIGRICMDQLMVDATGTGAKAGDVATIRGREGDLCITTKETAELLDTISYELFCAIGERIPRIYV
ncbi:MAG: alanine racemase [Clostridia bacterium]|nr:alanine racemase [Clostridia bacterium]